MSEEKRLTDKEIDGILKSGQVGFELAHRDDPRSIAALCRFAMDNRGYLRTLVNEIGALRLDLAAKDREIERVRQTLAEVVKLGRVLVLGEDKAND